jgi:predicted O-linked N-acetylglucosamine transferase (SPINDLY family)
MQSAAVRLGLALLAASAPWCAGQLALSELVEAIHARPSDPALHFYLGNALVAAGRVDDAHASFAAAANLAGDVPDAAAAWLNLGNVEADLRDDHVAALRSFARCVELQLAHAQCELNAGNSLTRLERHAEARGAYARAFAAEPEWGEAAEMLLTSSRRLMRWADWEATLEDARSRLRAELRAGDHISVQPFAGTFGSPYSLAEAKAIAMASAQRVAHGVPAEPLAPLAVRASLRVALVHSSPWRSQIAPHLEALVRAQLESHGRSRLELSVWSTAAVWPSSPAAANLSDAALELWSSLRARGRLREVRRPAAESGGSAGSAFAEWCRPHARRRPPPHVLVLLSAGGELDADRVLFARRCAPVQLLWLDWPGTSGAPWVDGFLADARALPAPAVAAAAFTERLVLMPHSLYVNGHLAQGATPPARARPPAATLAAAAEAPPAAWRARGLRVIACRNLAQKLEPHTFDSWASLLARTPGSALWLFAAPPDARRAQLAEAMARGVPAARVASTGRVPREQHAALLASHTTLWVDTPSYNAHSTGADVLFAALPAVGLAADKFASRLFPSMLCAVGACELRTHSYREYADLAVHLLRAHRRHH